MIRKTIATAASALLVVGLLGAAPDTGFDRQQAANVGDTDLFNFEHVGNITLANVNATQASRAVDNHGTDVELFTTPVTVDDGNGGTTTEDRDCAGVGDHSDGIGIIDITDPENAVVADYISCANPRSDVGVFQWTEDDGTLRTFVGSSRESGALCTGAGPETTYESDDGNPLTSEAGGFSMFEVTDPYDAQPFARVRIGAGGAHNFMFHPTAPVAYAWNGEIGAAEVTSIQIVDMSPYFVDGGAVTEIRSFIGPDTIGSPHDGELSPDGSIMYVASEIDYLIYDNTDPLDPQLTTAFAPNEGTYAHGYFPSPDGNIAVTNNESLALGGFFASRTGVCPGEGLAFYDTSISGAAVGPLSYYVPPVQGQTPDHRACTSHFGRVAPNNTVMSVAWYVLGGRVVDFTDPTLPVEIGAATISLEDSESGAYGTTASRTAGTEAWSAKFYKGPYMYVGDQGRGFDIFKWTGPEECGNPFDESWTGWIDCEELDFRLIVDPSAPTAAPEPTTVFTPAMVGEALAVVQDEDGTLRFSCQVR